MFFSCTVSWWPGEKTGAENKQISQYLRRWRNPAAFQVLGISRATPTGDTHHSDTFLSLSWSQNFLQPYFSRSTLKYKTCRSPNTPRAALLQLSPVISYLLPTAAFTSGTRWGQLIWAAHRRGTNSSKGLHEPPKKTLYPPWNPSCTPWSPGSRAHNTCTSFKHRNGSRGYFSPDYS